MDIQHEHTQGTYIQFVLDLDESDRKTDIWFVTGSDESTIGTVRWFGRWRKYGFFPNFDTVFEEVCLREIAEFCQEQTKRYKAR